jgi:hypothetical protein
MKLAAFHDRKDDQRRDVGRHHAMDLYRTVALVTEPEHERAALLLARHEHGATVERARQIVAEDFRSPTAIGILRLQEHPLYQSAFPVADFIRELHALLGMRVVD